MEAKYISKVYDLTQFGIYKIKKAIACFDADDGISVGVSFNGGASFVAAENNVDFDVKDCNGKIQVKIIFKDQQNYGEYMVKCVGNFQNLQMGTKITFTKNSNGRDYSAIVWNNGRYAIMLPRGIYTISYKSGNEKVVLMDDFNPEINVVVSGRMDKEAIIEGTFKEIPWAKYGVFDTFYDYSNLNSGNAIIDSDGDLSDGITNRKVRYWMVGFS